MNEYEYKAPQDAILPDFVPQERFTGDILKGRGPRRGNLERLLRYWRPIMKKPGGFRRCKVILADHPELYPLNNICAWLHHQTTGLWPNEGCHHPGMKNCRKKIKKGINGSLFSDAEFSKRLRKATGNNKKSATSTDEQDYDTVVTNDDIKNAILVLKDFQEMESGFCKMISDDNNWEIEGEDESDGQVKSLPFVRNGQECC
jgi:hypothetical protein